MKRYIVLLAGVVLALSGCDKSPLMLSANPIGVDYMKEYVASNSPVRIAIKASSKEAAIKHVVVKSYDEVLLYQTVMDSALEDAVKQLNMEFLYQTGAYPDTTTVQITTTVYSTDGDMAQYAFRLYVLPDGSSLRQLDGITMYSASSRKKCGFSLLIFNTIYPDSNRIDSLTFYDMVQTDTLQRDNLSRCWYSKSGVYFARSESFDYAEATTLSLQQTYSNCKRDSVVPGLKNDDVLLFGRYNEALGVIKILLIDDPAGTQDDRYVFNMKYAE